MSVKLNLKKKLTITFLCIGLVPVLTVGIYTYHHAATALKNEAKAKTQAVTVLKKKLIEEYFAIVGDIALTLSTSDQMKSALTDFTEAYNSFPREQGFSQVDILNLKQRVSQFYKDQFYKEYQNQNKDRTLHVDSIVNSLDNNSIALQGVYIADNQSPLGSKHLLSIGIGSGTYNTYHSKHHPTLLNYLQKYEFYDIFLIDGETGNVVYTVYKELDFATSVKTGPHKDSGLARVFQKAMVAAEDEVVMEDYSTYLPSYENPAGFVAIPIKGRDGKKGVLAFQLSVFDKINSMLGTKTGNETKLETFLVGPDHKMRSDTIFDKENRNVKASFKYPKNGLMETATVDSSLKGTSSNLIADSYIGKEAVISSSPVNFFGITWAIETIYLTEEALAPMYSMRWVALALITIFSIGICIFSFLFGRKLSNTLTIISEGLRKEAKTVADSSILIADAAGKLSEATTQQAASLQQTVASIDEISAMVSRNADSASNSANTSEITAISALRGKEKIETMMGSIHAIASGNDEIINQTLKSNREITEIVKVIEEISDKTQVINDIVFQTKLLSFNASVEAARAGEHGKGFAVVAEEVGNLASMSGKAANEITEMLSRSVRRVTDIVEGTKSLMEDVIRQSKQKVEFGTSTAKDCANALDEILANVTSVNEMVREISNASHEQSSGVKEVNKAMSELDHVTQSNSSIAQEASLTAGVLKEKAVKLNQIVSELKTLVNGSDEFATTEIETNVFQLKKQPEEIIEKSKNKMG